MPKKKKKYKEFKPLPWRPEPLAHGMHQPVELMALADEEFDLNYSDFDNLPSFFKRTISTLSLRQLIDAMEYADDGKEDYLELVDMCNSEMEFIEWFVEGLDNRDSFDHLE